MTFPRRGTRRLTVEGVEYLWHVSERHGFGDPATIQAVDGGPIIHYWPHECFPSPAEAASIIRFATVHDDPSSRKAGPIWVDRLDGRLAICRERPTSPWERKAGGS